MINNTYFKPITEEKIDLSSKTVQDAKVLLAKYRQMLLAELKMGDTLQGVLTKGEGNTHILELKQGIKLPVALLGEAELGKLVELIVQKNEEGKLYLHVNNAEEQSFLDKVITSLQLPRTEEMADCIKSFMEENLPLDKDTLLQSHYLHKKIELPLSVITNVLEKTGMLDTSSLEKVQDLKQGGLLELIDKLKGIIGEVRGKENLLQLLNTLGTALPEEALEQIISIPKPLSEDKSVQDAVKLLQNPNPNPNPNLNPNESPRFLDSEEGLLFKDNFKTLYTKLLQNDRLGDLEEPTILKAVILKIVDKLTIFDKKDYADHALSKEDQSKPVIESYKHLAKVVNTLEKLPLEPTPKGQLAEIRETLGTLGKINAQGDYFMFPFMPSMQKTQGEVYFFKPKKKEKQHKEEVYAVVALDLPALKHIEIHVKKAGTHLDLSIHTESKKVQEHMIEHMPKLGAALEEMGFAIGHCAYKLLGELKDKGNSEKHAIHLTSLDLKA